MINTDLMWVAGLLEGEGTFLVKTGTSGYPIVRCAMTDLDVILRLQALCGGTVHHQKQKNLKWKPVHVWTLGGTSAFDLMSNLLPYMGERRSEKISEVLEKSEESTKLREDARDKRQRHQRQAAEAYANGEGSLRVLAKKFKVSQVTILN